MLAKIDRVLWGKVSGSRLPITGGIRFASNSIAKTTAPFGMGDNAVIDCDGKNERF
jgi:hypothetical protein